MVSPCQWSDLGVFEWVYTFIARLKTTVCAACHASHSKFERYPSRCLVGPQYRNKRLSNMHSWIARLLHNCARNKPCPEAGFRAGIVRTS